jgi:hypothetical protein
MRALGASVLVAAIATTAHAQSQAGAPEPAQPSSAVSTLPAATPPPSSDGAAPAAAAAPVRPATGYGYGDSTPRARPARKATRRRATGAVVATLPGFEMLPDGGSRLFVELTRAAAVEEKTGAAPAKRPRTKGKGAAATAARESASSADASRLTFVIKGAEVHRRNTENALVTVHFNTPVSRARLVPAGRDLHFIVDLRATSTPAWKVTAGKDDQAVLQIDFPKGEFLPSGAPSAAASAPAAGSPPAAASGAPSDATEGDDEAK